MSWKNENVKKWYQHWFLWTLLLLAASAFFGWPRVRGRYERWSADRQARRAADFLSQGDFKHALLEAKSAVLANPRDATAARIGAEASEAVGAAQAAVMWRDRLDSLEPGNVQNLVAWASDSLKAGDAAAAERILATVKPDARDNADYHAAAAEVAMEKRNSSEAEKHWAEASRLNPQEERYKLPLATLRLGSKDAKLREAALKTLQEISRKPPKSIVALRTLLADATKMQDLVRQAELVDALVADPGATFEDKLTKLGTLRALQSAQATGYLTELRNEAILKPYDLYLLLTWMNQNNLALLVSEWARTLPPDVVASQPACVAIADAYVRSSDWKTLREYLDEHTWSEMDYMRRAFLARALEHLEDPDRAAQEWKDSVSAANGRPDAHQCLERLANAAVTWGWQKRAEEVMWMLAGSPGCPRWVLNSLWAICIERSDTAQLQKLAGFLAQADPKSVALRNRYAYFSLLVHSDQGNPHREAEKLLKENPGNANITVTRGLSLYQQGKFAEAAALTGSLPPGELKKPNIALFHAIFLTAAGEAAKAAEFLPVAQTWKMLPEETALLMRSKLMVEKAADEQGVAEASKAARALKAARELETEKAVEAARAARAAQAAKLAEESKNTPVSK